MLERYDPNTISMNHFPRDKYLVDKWDRLEKQLLQHTEVGSFELHDYGNNKAKT